MEESITVACIMDCPMITLHAGKCYKALINSGADISLLWYSNYKNIGDSYKMPIQPSTAKLEHCRWFPYHSPGNDSFTFEDSRIKLHPQFCNL